MKVFVGLVGFVIDDCCGGTFCTGVFTNFDDAVNSFDECDASKFEKTSSADGLGRWEAVVGQTRFVVKEKEVIEGK